MKRGHAHSDRTLRQVGTLRNAILTLIMVLKNINKQLDYSDSSNTAV